MPDDAREPFRGGSVDRLAIELSIVEWQTVTQVLSLAPYVRVWKVLAEIERQARAHDALRAAAMAEGAHEELRRAVNLAEQRRQEGEVQRMRAHHAEEELRRLKREMKRAKKKKGEPEVVDINTFSADILGDDDEE